MLHSRFKIIKRKKMELEGNIKLIGIEQTFGKHNGFRKREVVLVTDEKYPQSILIEFTQDSCDLLDKFKEGQDVKIGINIRGREWVNPEGVTKYFNSINGWRIESQEPTNETSAPTRETFAPEDSTTDESEPDDLPF